MIRMITVTLATMFFIQISAQVHPITILEEGHILVSLKVNDSIPANFILDTGAGITVMSSKFFNKISENSPPEGFFTGFRHDGDRLDGELFSVKSIDLGGYVRNDIVGGVYPPLDNYGIDGLLSMTFFKDKAFTIDYQNQKIRLLSDDELKSIAANSPSVPLSLNQKSDVSLDISIPICVNGEFTVDAEFDTGSGHELFLINPYFMNDLGIDSSKLTSSIYTTPISQKKLTDYSSEQKLGICGTGSEYQKKSVLFREGLIYEALIGSGLFSDKSITIDIPGKRFFVHN
ncbi:MAG: retropepsin-like aspartic protease [Ekhidna sp.]